MKRIIEITDVILRDAHQSLMATRMGISDMVPVCEDLDEAGYWSMECWGGATFDACIRFLNEDPWERLRTFKQLIRKTPLQMLLRGQNLLGYRHYGDDVVGRFVERAAHNGMDVFRIFDALNDLRNLETATKAVKKTGKHAQGTICYTLSPIHTIDMFVDQAKRLQDMGCDSICIKDMAGLIKPQPAYDLVRGIKQACGAELKVHLHAHATTGVTLVSLMKAVEAGVDIVDTSVSSMSLGTGHNPTESFVEMLEGTPYGTRLNMDRVYKVKVHFEKVRQRYGEFMTSFSGVETEIFKSQIPGGMLSNMESQIKQQGAGHRMAEVLLEVPKVREDAGFPPLVTPSSQIVGSQAVFNVMMGRYKKMTGEFADLMLGYYGATAGPKNAEVVRIAADQTHKKPITERPADLIKPEWDTLLATAAKTPGFNGADEDVLTLAMFPQVAPKFFAERVQGAKNLGKEPTKAGNAPVAAAVPVAASTGVGLKPSGPRKYTIAVNGQSYAVSVADGHDGHAVVTSAVPVAAPAAAVAAPVGDVDGEAVTSELAGLILKISTNDGDTVAKDDPLLVMEAMKMETTVYAARAGRVRINVKPGEQVNVGHTLAWIG